MRRRGAVPRWLLVCAFIAAAGAIAFGLDKLFYGSAPPAYAHAMPGAPAPDADAEQMFAYFDISVPDVPFVYAGSLHGGETPVLSAKLTAACQSLNRYAAANGLKTVDWRFLGDGTALGLAASDGRDTTTADETLGRQESLDGGTAKIELIVFDGRPGENCTGYLGASDL